MFSGLVCWIVVGLIVGFVASKVVKLRGDDPKLGIFLGAAGGVVGGFLFAAFSKAGMNVFDVRSLLAAAAGAVVALAGWHGVRGYLARA